METYENKIFISYAWGGESENIVNEIDQSLQRRGITIIRDKRDLGYKGSIKEFMGQIGRGNCVIVVVSDKYLKSPNCMFELVEISENKLFNDRIFPIVLQDANIYDPVARIAYVKHWELKREELAGAIRQVDPANLQGIYDDMNNYDRFRGRISELATILKDMNTLTLELHQDSNFDDLYISIEKRMKSSRASEEDITTSSIVNENPMPDKKNSTVNPHSTYPSLGEIPEGMMNPKSYFYIDRLEDTKILNSLKGDGFIITIKGPRQVGKSSLLSRTIKKIDNNEKQIAFLDFQLLDDKCIADPNVFFRRLCMWVTDKIKIIDKTDEYWQHSYGSAYICTKYISEYVLPSLSKKLLIAIDETEHMFESPFRSDFFGMIRSWHSDRAINDIWDNLGVILITSTEPNMFITNSFQSPFNIGLNIEMSDFTEEHVRQLNDRYNSPLTAQQISGVVHLLGGQPYLTQRTLYFIASGYITYDEVMKSAHQGGGIFADHLQKHLANLQTDTNLTKSLFQVISTRTCSDDLSFTKLNSAGLALRKDSYIVPRCELYAQFFKDRLNVR